MEIPVVGVAGVMKKNGDVYITVTIYFNIFSPNQILKNPFPLE